MRRLALCAILGSVGCAAAEVVPSGVDAATDAAAASTDTGADASTAAETTAAPNDTGAGVSKSATRRVMVVDTMGFTREVSPGICPGFDVDGKTSDDKDPAGCKKADQMSPEGQKGIDNQLATLVPLFEAFGLGAAEGLVQGAIKDGGILLIFELDGLDDPMNDSDVTVLLRAGMGKPLLGTDGLLLPGQTFSVHPDSPERVAKGATVKDGVIDVGPFEASLPIVVFGVRYNLTIKDARLRGRLTWDGGIVEGIFGGGVPIADLIAVGKTAAMDDASVLTAIEAIFGSAGDLAPQPDGSCAQVSAALKFTAVSAYFFD